MGDVMKKCAKVCLVSEDRNSSSNNLSAFGPEDHLLFPTEHTRISTESDHAVFFERSTEKQDDKGVKREIILFVCCINGILD